MTDATADPRILSGAEFDELATLMQSFSPGSKPPASSLVPTPTVPVAERQYRTNALGKPVPNLETPHSRGVEKRLEMRWDVLWNDPSLWTQVEYHEHFASRMPGYADVAEQRETPEEMLARMGVPTRYRQLRIADWQPPNGSERLRVQGYVATWPPAKSFMTLVGNRGTGKTHLAAAGLREVAERHGVRGLFVVVPDLIDRYRRTQNPERATETAEDVDDLLRRVPLLVLDDLGVGRQTEFAEERMYGVINRRYNDVRPTIVTTNVPLMELEERIRSRVLSGEVVQFRGEDRRLAG